MIQISRDADLASFTTFGVPAEAAELAVLRSRDELSELSDRAEAFPDRPRMVLGAGSDVLFTKRFDGLVIVNRLAGIEELPRGSAGEYRVKAASGESWDQFVRTMTLGGHPGLENLVLIPGSVGGAAVQNIGAYGVEAAERIESVEVYDLRAREIREISCGECDFGYRSSFFKSEEAEDLLILSVTFSLPAENTWVPVTGYKGLAAALEARSPDAAAVMTAVEALRRAKLPDPAEVGNAGSFYKNPVIPELQARALLESYPKLVSYMLGGRRVKLAAGWLIDAAGFRGAVRGGAAVWDKQALVLVNRGGATGEDVLALSDAIVAGVREKFGVTLEPEVVIR